MDIKLIRAFITLADKGNYRAAAADLCLTQPALTKQIQMLERKIGVNLFVRGRHGAQLTEEGKQLYPASSTFLKQHNDFMKYISNIGHAASQKLSLGFGISSYQLAPELVNAFSKVHPAIDISLKDLPSTLQCQMLLDGELDIGFLRLPVCEDLHSRLLITETLMLAVSKNLQRSDSDVFKLLSSQKLLQVSPSKAPCLSGLVNSFLIAHKIKTKAHAVAEDIHTLLALIAANNGVALLPSAVSHFLPANVSLLACPASPEEWQIGVAWNPQFSSPSRDLFLKMLDENFRTPALLAP